MLNRDYFYRQAVNPDDKLIIAKILDKAEEVQKEHEPRATGFLDPYQQVLAKRIAQGLTSVGYFFDGGYPGAERQRLVFHPDYLDPAYVDPQLVLVKITGNFKFQQVTHRDYLGAILGLGLSRDKLGDILIIQEGGAQVIADPLVLPFLRQNLEQVHQVTVRIEEIKREEIALPEEKVKEIRATAASLRLDAVAGEGFGISRSQMTKEITSEKVKLNWFVTTDCAQKVAVGDVISLRGRGRILVNEITGISKKGRIGLIIKRYL